MTLLLWMTYCLPVENASIPATKAYRLKWWCGILQVTRTLGTWHRSVPCGLQTRHCILPCMSNSRCCALAQN